MSDNNSEFTFKILEDPLVEKFKKENLSCYPEGLVRITPSNCCMLPEYQKHADRIRRFTVRPDDVWIVTYPKCGTTWTQEMVWLLMNNLDYESAKKIPLSTRSPFFEFGCLFANGGADTLTEAENLKSPRIIKSHLNLELLPEQLLTVKPKIIYVTREAKDAAVSYYHHHRLMFAYTGTLDAFVDAYTAGIVLNGTLWDHILEFWKIRNESNILFSKFEEMKKDLPGVVKRTAKFLNVDLNDEQLNELCRHLSFESMKNNPMVNHEDEIVNLRAKNALADGERFMRKGEVGSWKVELSPEAKERIDKWTQEKISGTDYPISVY